MSLNHTLVHVDDVHPENMKKGEGWAISEFRLPISGKDGSSTTLFHSIFRPGSTHARHLHRNCDEIAVYLKGHGIVGQSSERTEVRPGYCRLMPRGSEHFFFNETKDEDGLVIGFYVGAKSVPDTGYEFRGAVTEADLEVARREADPAQSLRLPDDAPFALFAVARWLVATNDVHFLNKDDHHAHDVLCCISMGRLLAEGLARADHLTRTSAERTVRARGAGGGAPRSGDDGRCQGGSALCGARAWLR